MFIIMAPLEIGGLFRLHTKFLNRDTSDKRGMKVMLCEKWRILLLVPSQLCPSVYLSSPLLNIVQ